MKIKPEYLNIKNILNKNTCTINAFNYLTQTQSEILDDKTSRLSTRDVRCCFLNKRDERQYGLQCKIY